MLERIAHDAGVSPPPVLTPAAMQLLLHYRFPGNVRELENMLHRALALSGNDQIGPSDLGLPGDEGIETTIPMALMPAPAPAPAAPPPGAALPDDIQAHLDAVERDILLRALERHRYNRTAAGASLGLSLRQMRYRMARLGVDAGVSGAD